MEAWFQISLIKKKATVESVCISVFIYNYHDLRCLKIIKHQKKERELTSIFVCVSSTIRCDKV
jgi:hypothetical protein